MKWKRFTHWRTRRRLQSERDKISRHYAEKRLKADISPEKQQELDDDEHSEISFVDDQINQEFTWYWVYKAESLMLPVADLSDENCWQDSQITWRKHLTPTYLATLRSSVRKEQKESWEFWQMVLSLVIGMIGALIGLISVLKK